MTPGLIARLDWGPLGSRELDVEICWLVEPMPQGRSGPEWRQPPHGPQQHVPTVAPAYTTSLDAALTLVPPGCTTWELDWNGHARALAPYCATIYLAGSSRQHNGDAVTPALALCIAALRAREAKP